MIFSAIQLSFFLSISVPVARGDTTFIIPEKWKKDFRITISQKGAMRGVPYEIIFTYDSCRYLTAYGINDSEKYYLMKEADRLLILKKLKDYKTNKIKSESNHLGITYDKGSTGLCLQYKSHLFCVFDSQGSEIKEESRGDFRDTFDFLYDFGIKKAIKKKKKG